MKFKQNSTVFGFLIIITCLMLSGCQNSDQKERTKPVTEKQLTLADLANKQKDLATFLSEKYGRRIQTESLRLVEKTYALDESHYETTATDTETGNTFEVWLDLSFQEEKDNFVKVWYEKGIAEKVAKVTEEYPDIVITSCKMIYPVTSVFWEEENLEEYLKAGGSFLSLRAWIEEDSEEEIVEKLDDFFWALKKEGLSFEAWIEFQTPLLEQHYTVILC